MSYLMAWLIPAVPPFLKGRIGAAIGLALLQLTILGWIPAALISMAIVNDANREAAAKKAAKIQGREMAREAAKLTPPPQF